MDSTRSSQLWEISFWEWRMELWHPPLGDLQLRRLSIPFIESLHYLCLSEDLRCFFSSFPLELSRFSFFSMFSLSCLDSFLPPEEIFIHLFRFKWVAIFFFFFFCLEILIYFFPCLSNLDKDTHTDFHFCILKPPLFHFPLSASLLSLVVLLSHCLSDPFSTLSCPFHLRPWIFPLTCPNLSCPFISPYSWTLVEEYD